jgi:hypothetical protein
VRLRVLLALGALAALAALVSVRGAGRGVADGARPAPAPPAVPASVPAPTEVPIDPAAIRDIFRYADEAAVARRSAPGPSSRAGGDAVAPSSPSRARLVGLVRRAGRLFAALAIEGDVLLLGPGESASGYTVLAVGEEGIRLRGPDGREETLALP